MKHLVSLDIPDPQQGKICDLMDVVAEITGLPPPSKKLPAHVSFHRPVEWVEERVLHNLIRSATLQLHRSRIRLIGFDTFHPQYFVLPVVATRVTATFWVVFNDLLARLSEYEHGPYDHDNTLHVTVAEKTSAIFDRTWPLVRQLPFDPIDVPLDTISLWRKEDGGKWEKVQTFLLPD